MTGALPMRDGENTGSSVNINLQESQKVVAAIGERLNVKFSSINSQSTTASTTATTYTAGFVTDIIRDFFLSDLPGLVERLGGIDQVIATAQLAYRTYVAPIDIPTIPDFVESIFDNYMEVALGNLIRKAWQRLQKP